MPLNFESLATPISLRPAITLSDEEFMRFSLDNGAQLAWLVDPIDAHVTIYRPVHEVEKLDSPETVAAAAPVEGFVLDCGPLWPTA